MGLGGFVIYLFCSQGGGGRGGSLRARGKYKVEMPGGRQVQICASEPCKSLTGGQNASKCLFFFFFSFFFFFFFFSFSFFFFFFSLPFFFSFPPPFFFFFFQWALLECSQPRGSFSHFERGKQSWCPAV